MPTPPPVPSSARSSRLRTLLAWSALTLLALACLSRFLSSLAWPLDLLANISSFFALPALLLAGFLLWRRRFVRALLCAVLALTALFPLLPSPAARSAASAHALSTPSFSLLEVNLHSDINALRTLIPIISRENPDFITLIECGGQPMLDMVSTPELRSVYPFAVVPEPGLAWQIVILSRHPLHPIKYESARDPRFLQLFAHRRSVLVDLPDSDLDFILAAVHPPSPRTADSWADGNETISLLSDLIRSHMLPTGKPVLIAGDFNTSTTGCRQSLMASSGLHPLDDFSALPGTWPASLPLPLRITLDRAWASDSIIITSRTILEDIGSDHLPLLFRFTLPPSPRR